METKELLAVVATLFAIIGNVPYLIDVIKQKVKPHPYTWLVWTIVSAVTFFGAVAKGAGVGAIPTGVAEIFTVIIFFFSLRYGYFLIFALLGLIPWAITKDPTISVIIVVSIDFIAFLPTLRKTWTEPKTETALLYEMNVSRHILTLFSIQSYNIATMLHSIVMIVMNTIMSFIILWKKRVETKKLVN